MGIALDVDVSRMMYAIMSVALALKLIVRLPLVCEYHRRGQHSFLKERNQGVLITVGNHLRDDRALSLKHARNRSFANRAASLNLALAYVLMHVLCLAAEKALVGFYLSAKWIAIFIKHHSDLFEHAPRGFVGHTCFTHKLHRGDTAARRG